MAYYRRLRWVILALLIATTFFLASFNSTLRYIVDQRREFTKNQVSSINNSHNNKVKESANNKKKVYTYDEIDKESFGGVKQPDGTYEFGTQTAELAKQKAQDNEELAQALHTEQLKKKEQPIGGILGVIMSLEILLIRN